MLLPQVRDQMTGTRRALRLTEAMAGHAPVMVQEVLQFLGIRRDGNYIDATLGGGGHAEAILDRLGGGTLLGIDRDPAMVASARERLQRFGSQFLAVQGNFAEIGRLHAESGQPVVDGMIADLGINSVQLEDATRGFSFDREGPLDMRVDPALPTTAAELVNRSGERELADMLFSLGEERHSRRIARAIVKARPIHTTTTLAQVVLRAIPSRAGLRHLHPATRTFMALRLAVNDELKNLAEFLSSALPVLAPEGRLIVLSFHSLEDRRVKHAFREWEQEGRVQLLTRKPARPSSEEVRANPRSRSAKLRSLQVAAHN
jgi:16S rRNA (cytosine1402-N4)-methyltransferase